MKHESQTPNPKPQTQTPQPMTQNPKTPNPNPIPKTQDPTLKPQRLNSQTPNQAGARPGAGQALDFLPEGYFRPEPGLFRPASSFGPEAGYSSKSRHEAGHFPLESGNFRPAAGPSRFEAAKSEAGNGAIFRKTERQARPEAGLSLRPDTSSAGC